MPRYTYPLQAGELTLPVLIGLGSTEARSRLAAGLATTPLAWGTGVIDTGATVTSVSSVLIRHLGTGSLQQATSHTAAGRFIAAVHEVSLSIPAPGPGSGPMLTLQDLTVMEMAPVIPGVDVLIGLDILLGIKLLLDGPAGTFTLEF